MSDRGVWRGRHHLPSVSPPSHATLLSLVTLQEYHTWRKREGVRCRIFLTIPLPGAPELHTTWSNFYCSSLAPRYFIIIIIQYGLQYKQYSADLIILTTSLSPNMYYTITVVRAINVELVLDLVINVKYYSLNVGNNPNPNMNKKIRW